MPEGGKECLWCDRMWAVLGLMVGAAVAYMAIDLLRQGGLTRSITKSAPRLASVTNLAPADDGAS